PLFASHSAGAVVQATRRILTSSKWLVFKRPEVAGFERPLTACHAKLNSLHYFQRVDVSAKFGQSWRQTA
ncbi:MAG TPA: hypothetical protein VGP68_05355, partial [Gemmataceae bacterium]|nr:hypothetical protein [Gemmataceae bacterium]